MEPRAILDKIQTVLSRDPDYLEQDVEFAQNKAYISVTLCGKVVLRLAEQKQGMKLTINNNYLNEFHFEPNTITHSDSWSQVAFTDGSIDLILSNIEAVYLICMKESATETFGCCSSFTHCSEVRHCTHTDKLFSRGCMYKYNLRNGLIYYGKNKNFPRSLSNE